MSGRGISWTYHVVSSPLFGDKYTFEREQQRYKPLFAAGVRIIASRKKTWGERNYEVILNVAHKFPRMYCGRSGRKELAIGDQWSAGGQGSIFTIGHSNHSADKFASLLKGHGIEILVDTRSRPYSRYAPHFNARDIEVTMSNNGIGYLFLGLELGGRPEEEEFYDAEGRVDYALIEKTRPFLDGIHRLEKEIQERRVALLCSEEDPSGCHRRLLVSRALSERGIAVRHIRGDGSVQREGETASNQPALFPEAEVSVRKSIRSVLRRRRRPSSSGRSERPG